MDKKIKKVNTQEIAKRFKKYTEATQLSGIQLSKKWDISSSTINNALQGKNLPGVKILLPLAEEGINTNWLLVGEGPMYYSELRSLTEAEQIIRDKLTETEDQLKEAKETIRILKNHIALLEQQ